MNPSRLFILRPVATSLLMVAVLLSGIVAYRLLPLSALPEVDYPTIQVVTLYPGASPDVTTSSVTAPLERQFGQMPGLNQMSSTSSGGASVITLQFSLDLTSRRRRTGSAGSHQCRQIAAAAGPALAADLQQGQSGRRADPLAGGDFRIAAAAAGCRTWSTRGSRRRSPNCPASAWSRMAGGQRPAVRIQANPRALGAYGLSLDDLRTGIDNANVNQAKGSFDGPTRASTIDANDQLKSAAEYLNLIIAYKNGARDPVERCRRLPWTARRTCASRRGPTTRRRSIVNIQRQPGANVIEVVDRVKKLLPQLQASLPGSVDVALLTDRTTTIRASVKDVQFELIVASRAGRDGHFPVPAQCRRPPSFPAVAVPLVAGRHFRRDVPRRVQHQQPHADGADHRHRLRGGRCHRDDREHLPLHRAGGKTAGSRAEGCRSRSALPSFP